MSGALESFVKRRLIEAKVLTDDTFVPYHKPCGQVSDDTKRTVEQVNAIAAQGYEIYDQFTRDLDNLKEKNKIIFSDVSSIKGTLTRIESHINTSSTLINNLSQNVTQVVNPSLKKLQDGQNIALSLPLAFVFRDTKPVNFWFSRRISQWIFATTSIFLLGFFCVLSFF